ncbi:MAG: tetratricopeptide repeat protein [Verrucomicrobiota bacterium JB022]|nr:tetratricopeptide repeat protein [Verrucomicrobiota bacterium JB022]
MSGAARVREAEPPPQTAPAAEVRPAPRPAAPAPRETPPAPVEPVVETPAAPAEPVAEVVVEEPPAPAPVVAEKPAEPAPVEKPLVVEAPPPAPVAEPAAPREEPAPVVPTFGDAPVVMADPAQPQWLSYAEEVAPEPAAEHAEPSHSASAPGHAAPASVAAPALEEHHDPAPAPAAPVVAHEEPHHEPAPAAPYDPFAPPPPVLHEDHADEHHVAEVDDHHTPTPGPVAHAPEPASSHGAHDSHVPEPLPLSQAMAAQQHEAHAAPAHDDHDAHAASDHGMSDAHHGHTPEVALPARPPRDPMPSLVDVDTLERLLLEDEGSSNTVLRDFEPVSVDPKLQALERSAWVQKTIGQLPQAEKLYLQLLQETPDRYKPEIYLELANFYTETQQYLKTISVYERFVRRFEQDPRVPEVRLRLGMLYRRYENYKLAIDSFFSVLQISFYIPEERVDSYRRLSEMAQYEIAETYYQKGDYTRAAEFYQRLQRVSKSPKIQAEARLKQAYADLLLGNYTLVVRELRTFSEEFPQSDFLADSRFLLARAYYMLGDRDLARRETLKILGTELRPVDDSLWGYWLKTIGNQLANDLYESKDYEGAHRIYHALLSMSEDPEWRWPIVYQIGLCLERQQQDAKAIEIYARLLDQTSSLVEAQPDTETRQRFSELRQRAQTRLDHLQWRDNFNRQVDQLAPQDLGPLIKPS